MLPYSHAARLFIAAALGIAAIIAALTIQAQAAPAWLSLESPTQAQLSMGAYVSWSSTEQHLPELWARNERHQIMRVYNARVRVPIITSRNTNTWEQAILLQMDNFHPTMWSTAHFWDDGEPVTLSTGSTESNNLLRLAWQTDITFAGGRGGGEIGVTTSTGQGRPAWDANAWISRVYEPALLTASIGHSRHDADDQWLAVTGLELALNRNLAVALQTVLTWDIPRCSDTRAELALPAQAGWPSKRISLAVTRQLAAENSLNVRFDWFATGAGVHIERTIPVR